MEEWKNVTEVEEKGGEEKNKRNRRRSYWIVNMRGKWTTKGK